MGRSALLFGLLTLAVGYAVATQGGDAPIDSSLSLLLIGLTAVVGSLAVFELRPRRSRFCSPFDRALDVAIVAFPIYVAFQLIPLPLALLRLVSPVRAEVATALGGVMAAPHFAPLTIAPATTWVYLFRIAGYALIFLLVRQIARRSSLSLWAPAIPLVVIGGLEATWALTLPPVEGTPFSGTYDSRDHFAGLLEMILPFALAYGIALLSRRRKGAGISTMAAIGAAVVLAAAVAMFVAITLSVSKMGLFSSLGSLLVMGILGMQRTLSGRRRWPAVAGLIVLGLFAIVFLTPTTFVEQFGSVLSEGTTEGRLPIAKDTLRLFAAYPLFGCGLGSFYPGLMRYQMSGLNIAWVNAHNDYLQLLAELGIVGFLIPAVLVAGVFARSVRTALSDGMWEKRGHVQGDNAETRFLGLGCAGGLTAILIHSTGDYNTYVLANAMVLSWIMGIAASLPSPRSPGSDHTSSSGEAVRWIRVTSLPGLPFVLALGCAVIVYAGGWLVFLNYFQNDRSAERTFCRFGICDTDAAVAAPQGEQKGAGAEAMRVAQLLEYLPRDAAAPSRWEDVGEAMQNAGQTATARYSFARALTLGPNSPSTLLMAADFHLDVGEKEAALALMSRRLQAGGDESARAVFADLEFRKIPVDETLRTIPLDKSTSRNYLRLLTNGDSASVERAVTLWEWMVGRGYTDDPLAREQTEFLIGKARPELAWKSWALYAGGRSKGYPDANRIFNGDFESDPTGCRFDWRSEPASGMAIDFDRGVAYSGGRSLRVQFDGTANPGEIGMRQSVFLERGRYRLSGYVRTKDLSTDEGVFLRVVNEDGRVPLDAASDKLRGTNDWTLVDIVFDAPPAGGLVRISLARKPSLKFDSLLRGTVWLDQLTLSPLASAKGDANGSASRRMLDSGVRG